MTNMSIVIPAKAGTQTSSSTSAQSWIPASAGMTREEFAGVTEMVA
jgi:hypothetical protein